MTKVTKPMKEFYESAKKPDLMILTKKENDSGIIRIKKLKPKRRSKGSGLKKLEIK